MAISDTLDRTYVLEGVCVEKGRYYGTVAGVVFAVPQTVRLSGPMSVRKKLPITQKRA